MVNITPDTREEQDAAYSPEEQARRTAESLHNAEQQQAFDSAGNPDRLAGDGAPGNLADDARNAEENPTSIPASGGHINNFTGNRTQKLSKKLAKSFLKRKGPLLLISFLGLGGIALVLLVPALLLFNLLGNLLGTYNPSSTAITEVAKQLLINKLGANGATLGCSTIQIACRFKTPTNELLSELKENGITPLDSGGNPMQIDLSQKWPTERPTAFEVSSFATENGATLVVKAGDLSDALVSNTVFRDAFNKVLDRIGPRSLSKLSPAFLNVIEKFKLNLRNILGLGERQTSTGTRSIADVLSDHFELGGSTVGDKLSQATAAASAFISDMTLRINSLLTLVGKAGKGSGIVLLMAMQCMADEIPGMIEKTVTSMQEDTTVSAGLPVITAMSAVQAGDGDPDTVSQLANEWTQTGSNGKSALSAIGVRYSLYGDTDTSSDPTYQNVTPAAFGSALSDLDLANTVLDNPVSSSACALLMNPVSGAAIASGINVAVSGSGGLTFGVSFAVNLTFGVVMTTLINQFSGAISSGLSNVIAPQLGAIIQPTLNMMNQPGETFGNVVPSALGIVSENNGAQTFGTAMTTDQLPAYSAQIQSQELANAEADRATLSPFDASSPYTFLGTIVNQFMPDYSSFSSIAGSLSVLSNLIPISFGSILNMSNVNALSNTAANIYSDACPQPVTAVNGKTLAADIFCHTVYGIVVPNNWNPNVTVASMESMTTNGAQEINPDTGQPFVDNSALAQTVNSITDVSAIAPSLLQPAVSYADWQTTCTDPDNDTECTGDNATENTYGLYNAELTVNSMLDEDEATTSS